MKACGELTVERWEGRDRVTRLRSQAPLVLRMHASTLHLVGGAAGPLAGDETCLRLRVGPGAQLAVRSSAAALTLPGRGSLPSSSRVHVDIGAGGSLDWSPEPVVLAAGSHHRVSVVVTLTRTSVLRWREVVVLGRHGEPPGLLETSLLVSRGGAPLLWQEHVWGTGAPAGWDGPAGIGPARVVASLLDVGHPAAPATRGAAATTSAACLAIAEDARLQLALGASVPDVLPLLR